MPVSAITAAKWKPSLSASQQIRHEEMPNMDDERSGDRFFSFSNGEGWILFLALAVLFGMIAIGVALIYTGLQP